MNRKDVLEITRRFKKDACTISRVTGCYVNGEKKLHLTFRESFHSLEDEAFFKYLEIAKKTLSGGIGNNLLELNFTLDGNLESTHQQSLMILKKSGLKDDTLLNQFYQSIIDNIDLPGNFLILLFHDVYDVMTRTKDNIQLDESEEVYEYMICSICPVSLSKPGLGYFEQEKQIKPRIRDWVVDKPLLGFTFPGFIDRSSDVNAVMYYTKDAKEPHHEFMEKALGCGPKQTATIQKASFQSIIEKSIGGDEEISKKIFTDIQENLNTMVEDYKEMYEDTDTAPIALSKESVKNILINTGLSDEISAKIEDSFEEAFGEDLPLAESLIDSKLIKANAQKKKEDQLMKKVEVLETQLEEVKKVSAEDPAMEKVQDSPEESDDDSDPTLTETLSAIYDVVVHVKPDKLPSIKTEIINGQKCLVVPINDNEQAAINGMKHLT